MRIRSALPVVGACVVLLLVPSVARAPEVPAAPSRAELEAAKTRLLEIEREFELVSERYNAVHSRLIDIQTQMATTDVRANELSQEIAARQDEAVEMARRLYMNGGSMELEVALSASSLTELEQRLIYLESTGEVQEDVFERLSSDHAQLDAQFAALDDARARALQTEARLADLRGAVEAKFASQRAEIERLNRVVARAEAAAAARAEAAAATGSLGGYEGTAALYVGRDVQPEPATNPAAQAAVDYAMAQLGKPYQWGAQGPDRFDCSGLTMMAWAAGGVEIPRVSYVQYPSLPQVDDSDLEPGDLVFFGSPIHHVGMYIGRGLMVEAPYTGSFVRIDKVDRPDYVGAVRPNG